MSKNETHGKSQAPSLASRGPAAEKLAAWEQIEAGRYMPRRTRGSFPGRELG
jgi:hypothetical protein